LSRFESWLRPWLDHPGLWEIWQLEPNEKAGLIALASDAAASANETLRARYGDQSELFGAAGLIARLVKEGPYDAPLFYAALAIAAVDHYESRVTMRRPEPAGDTNPTSRKHWSVLRPYLVERLRCSIAENTAGSLESRAIFACLADNWLPSEQISRQLKRQLDDSGLFKSVEVTLGLRPSVEGGREWLRAETRQTLKVIKVQLARRRPVLIEILRDPTVSPIAAQVIVVYRLDEFDDGWLELVCYDPARGAEATGFRLSLTADRFVIYDVPSDQARVAPKGIRCVTVTAAVPPLFGLRHKLRWFLPWRIFWWLKRRWLLFATRKQDRALRSH